MIKYIIIFGVVAAGVAYYFWRKKKNKCPKIKSVSALVGLGDSKNKSMGFITLNSVTFQGAAQSNQTVSVYIKLASAPDVIGSYSQVSNNVAIQTNGFFFSPLTIGSLTDGVEYTVKIVNNCGGNGVKVNFVAGQTTAAPTTEPVTTTPPSTEPPTTAPVTTAGPTTPVTTQPPVTTVPVTTAPITTAPVTTVPPTTAPVTTAANKAVVEVVWSLSGVSGDASVTKTFGPGVLSVSPIVVSPGTQNNSVDLAPVGIHSFAMALNLSDSVKNTMVHAYQNGTVYFTNSYVGSMTANINATNIAPGDVIRIEVMNG